MPTPDVPRPHGLPGRASPGPPAAFFRRVQPAACAARTHALCFAKNEPRGGLGVASSSESGQLKHFGLLFSTSTRTLSAPRASGPLGPCITASATHYGSPPGDRMRHRQILACTGSPTLTSRPAPSLYGVPKLAFHCSLHVMSWMTLDPIDCSLAALPLGPQTPTCQHRRRRPGVRRASRRPTGEEASMRLSGLRS